jgi:hypothetical protein
MYLLMDLTQILIQMLIVKRSFIKDVPQTNYLIQMVVVELQPTVQLNVMVLMVKSKQALVFVSVITA